MTKHSSSRFFFGGEPVFVLKTPEDVENKDLTIICKGVVGKLSDLSNFLVNLQDTKFGKTTLTIVNTNLVKADCLEEELFHLKNLHRDLSALLKNSVEETIMQNFNVKTDRNTAIRFAKIVKKNMSQHVLVTHKFLIKGFKSEIAHAIYETALEEYKDIFLQSETNISGKNPPQMETLVLPNGYTIQFPTSTFKFPDMGDKEEVTLNYYYST